LYETFVWARRALNKQKRRFPARAVTNTPPAGTTVFVGSLKALEQVPTWTSGNTTGTGPGASLSLSADVHLNRLDKSYDRMYL
jgi:hypothetical protein